MQPLYKLLAALALATAAHADTLADFRLLDIAGRSHTLHRYKDAAAVVVMAAPVSDPALGENVAAFAALAKAQAESNTFFFIVTPAADAPELAKLAGDVPVLLDDAQIVLPALGLTHAYDCVAATSKDWNAFYRGPLPGGLGEALAAFNTNGAPAIATETRGAPLALDPMPQGVSYTKDIAPLLAEKCAKCHSEGNIGPFAMNSHRKIASHAGTITESILAGRMPPWQADPKYGDFSNAMQLTVQEKRNLIAWLNAGAPKDGDTDPLATTTPAPANAWRAGEPDLIVRLPEPQEIPAEGVLEYKYYDLPLDLPEGTWIRGTEVRISRPDVMHHILVYMHEPGQDLDFTREYLASYVPGHDPGLFPANTGKPVPKGAMLLFQLHYTTNGRPVTDNPELGIYLAKEKPEHEIFVGSGVVRDFSVPPNAPDARTEATFRADSDMVVYSLSPHMHYRGSRMSFEACYPDGKREMLLSVPNYDFHWQHSYHLAEPKQIPRGTAIRIVGAWDNSVRNPLNPDPTQTLHWGDQSTEEMFIGTVVYRRAG